MKKIIICMCSLVLILILILVAYTMYGRSVRKKELDNALSSGMQKAMQMLQAEEYAPRSNEEFIALFMEAFAINFVSNSEVTVHVLDADYEKGLLSVEAILTYKHPIGKEGTLSLRKTIIREEYSEDNEPEFCTIQYIVEGTLYKKYVLEKGTKLICPKEPQEKVFLGWKELEGDDITNIEEKTADRDYTFVAVFVS